VGTRKISQLDTISDANLSGEAILPLVVSDPLIPNRKAKVNQLFRGVAQGTKSAPGLAFDLDRNTGLYQNAYDQLGLGFGSGGLYMTRIVNSATYTSLYMSAVDEVATNADIVLSPKGTGAVKVTGNFVISDQTFILEDAQGPKVRFGNVGTGTNTRIFTMPAITSGNGTTLVGDDTVQTLRNKTLVVDEDLLIITDGDEEAIFQINWTTTQDARRSYFLPDAGTVTTTLEPTATSSTLLDTKAEQTVLNKSFVNVKLVDDAEVGTSYAVFDTGDLTANRTITVPDQSLTLLGSDTTQTVTNKTYSGAIFADSTDTSKRLEFDVTSSNPSTIRKIGIPTTNSLNTTSNQINVLATESATQTLSNKTIVRPGIRESAAGSSVVTIDTTNITANRTIKFPDADATLLSTENVTVDDVNFGAGIGAANLTSRTRLQQFFYAGF
jgi:hypothetical protein